MVIALDTSGSMSGLINAARQKLWDIVNEAAKAQPAPRLRVGLVTYGSSGSERDGYVVIRSRLTTDLDSIYSKLFELTTAGGTEYVGRVVHRSVRELNWDRDRRTLKQIFVAGNESADQDRRVRASTAVRSARQHGIFVNALYCGNAGGSEALGWRRVAKLGRGVFAAIDHNRGTVNIATPYDARLNALSAQLNRTYVRYGRRGAVAAKRQQEMDKKARRAHASAGAARAVAKASAVYDSSRWDLVDARDKGKLAGLGKDALPPSLRRMTRAELGRYLDKMKAARSKIRKQIVALSKARRSWARGHQEAPGGQGGARVRQRCPPGGAQAGPREGDPHGQVARELRSACALHPPSPGGAPQPML